MTILRSRADRDVLLVVAAGTALRLVLGAAIGLAVDESYTVTIARQLSPSYFDHPPLSFWIPGVLLRLGVHSGFVLRLPFIALFAGTTWLMYRLTERWWGERAGFYAALLLNLAPVFSLSTGGWILPDGPLDFAMLACVFCAAHVLVTPVAERPERWWMAAGAFAGMAILSKYHAVFLVFGLLLFMLTEPSARRWLATPWPYVAAGIAALALVPILDWNAAHDWASFRFQGGRGAPHGGVHFTPLLQNIGGQAGYLLPWLWAPLLWQLVRGLRMGPAHPRRWLTVCMAIGPIAVFTLVSLGGNPGLPHWPAPGYLFLFPALGEAAARWEARAPRVAHRWVATAATAFVVLVAIAGSEIATGWVTRLKPEWFRRGDPSLEAVNWSELPASLARLEPAGTPPAFVATTHWIDAAKAGYALGPDVPIVCLSDDPRHFRYLDSLEEFSGRDGLLVMRIDARQPLDSARARAGASSTLVGQAQVMRAGRPALTLAVFRIRAS